MTVNDYKAKLFPSQYKAHKLKRDNTAKKYAIKKAKKRADLTEYTELLNSIEKNNTELLQIYEDTKYLYRDCEAIHMTALEHNLTDIVAYTADLAETHRDELKKVFDFYDAKESINALIPTTYYIYTKLAEVKRLPKHLQTFKGESVASRGYVIPLVYLSIILKLKLSRDWGYSS